MNITQITLNVVTLTITVSIEGYDSEASKFTIPTTEGVYLIEKMIKSPNSKVEINKERQEVYYFIAPAKS